MTDIFKSADWAREAEKEEVLPEPLFADCAVSAERDEHGQPNGKYTVRRMPGGEIIARGVPQETLWPQYYA